MLQMPMRVTMLGDSLTAGFGLPSGCTLPSKLETALQNRGCAAAIENAGISGDTTAGGLARLSYLLDGYPELVLLALGANDALRGLPPEQARGNLLTIIERLQDRHINVILLGMYAPLYLSEAYRAAFNRIYGDLAGRYSLAHYEFLLDGVAMQPHLNQEDGLHPNEAGIDEIVMRLTPFLAPLLQPRSATA